MIDWITVGAQIVNFLILVVLLKIFLYDRVLKTMDQRKESVQQRFDQAEQAKSDAEQRAEDLQQQRDELENKRDELMQQARDNAEEHRREKRRQAEQEVRRKKQRWLETLEDRQADFVADLRRRTSDRLAKLSRKVLADLADADLQQRVVGTFLDRAANLDDETKRELQDTFADADTIEVAAAFELSDEQTQQIRDAVGQLIEGNPDVTVARQDDLICGIELRAGGHAVGWNIGDYVDQLTEDIRSAVDEQIRELREGNEQSEDQGDEGDEADEGDEGGEGNAEQSPSEEDADEQ